MLALTSLGAVLVIAVAPFAEVSDKSIVRFDRDVQPILTKAGCNQGACHGAQLGKGGFKLSLRGFDATGDYFEIAKSAKGRRLAVTDAAASLLLAKPTLDIPHKGGKRFAKDSAAYETVLRWVEQGAQPPSRDEDILQSLAVVPAEVILQPGQKVTLSVVATYKDGRQENVAQKAGFDSNKPAIAEVTVDGNVVAKGKGDAALMVRFLDKVGLCRVIVPYAPAPNLDGFVRPNFVDEIWVQTWKKLGLVPAADCTDAEFVRRVHLDVIGTLPDPKRVRDYLGDSSRDKRSKLIDELLERPEYVDVWAHKWGDILRNNRDLVGEKGMWTFHNYLRSIFRDNRPVDAFVEEILTAVGSPNQNGPANFFQIGRQPTDWSENAAQIFMGSRMQCAKCHHHPFENISQQDYFGLAAYFAHVGTKQSQEFGVYGRDTVVFLRETGDVRHPRTGRPVPPHAPGGPNAATVADPRLELAKWLCDPANPQLSRNIVNRYWGYFMGRGLVDPIDDMRTTNPASSPELLDALAKHLVDSKFDLKQLLRTICNSHVYRLSANAHPDSEIDADNRYFTHYTVKRMTAEQLLDAIDFACGTKERFAQLPASFRAISLPDSKVVSRFLDSFGRPRREMTCECERTDTPNMTQALEFMTGNFLNRKVASKDGRIAAWMTAKQPTDKVVEEIYLHTVSRAPTDIEKSAALTLLKTATTPREGIEDLLWTMLNTREFQFNH